MMKYRIIVLALALCLLCAGMPAVSAADSRISAFSGKSNWKLFSGPGEVTYSNGLVVTPVCKPNNHVNGAIYSGAKLGSAVIEFDLKMEIYDDPFVKDQLTNEEAKDTFFSFFFLNNIDSAAENVSANACIPFNEKGGFPYMVSFDAERGIGEERAKQVGLTLRRYKSGGSHDYTRWSSVEPSEATFINDIGQSYQSLIPEAYSPVTIEDIWDGNTHSVKVDYKSLYKSNGDAYDAVEIKVYYDDVLSLHVIDEMPFSEFMFGDETDVDKREKDGFIGFYAHTHANLAPSLEMWGYKAHVTNMFITSTGSNEGNTIDIPNEGDETDEPDDDGGCGCGSVIIGGWGKGGYLLATGVAGITVMFIINRKRKGRTVA